jgi:HK97 family phage prohead protease
MRHGPGVGFWSRIFNLTAEVEKVNASAAAEASFVIDADSIDPAVFGLTSYQDPVSRAPRVSRATAIQVGAVKRARDLIPGTLGGLPWGFIGPDKHTADPARTGLSLLEQPERNVPRSVTMARLFEDLFFEEIAWWRVTERSWSGYPAFVRRLRPREVSVEEATGRVYWRGQLMRDDELIRFDSPTDGLLYSAARAIRAHLLLDAAHADMVDGTPPVDYFAPADGEADPDETELVDFLNKWKEARRTRTTGYVPGWAKYNRDGWSPKDLLLGEARQEAVLEIARHAGVDPEELGVSTTSRTYANQFDRRKSFTDFTLGQFFKAVQDRLSMGDVCPRGYVARLNLTDLLLSDPSTRYAAYEIGLRVGAITPEQIAEQEGNPTVNQPQGIPAAQTDPSAAPPAASLRVVGETFDTAPEIRLDAPSAGAAFAVDRERRVIRGLAVPYGIPARSGGKLWQFAKGTLQYADPTRVKLWIQHDPNRAVGFAMSLDDREDGLYPEFKVARGAAGDEALSMAEDGVWDGFSIGIAEGGRYQLKDGVMHAIEAPLMEVSLTPAPSFDDARVHSVAASAAGSQEGNTMPEGTTTEVEAPTAPDFSALSTALADSVSAGFAAAVENLRTPQGPEVIHAGGGVERVSEELPYRFDGIPGAHSFSADIRAMAGGDGEARQRVEEFMDAAFAVSTGNVGTLNPTQNRPELYVPNLTFTRPLWDLVTTGNLVDKTPFTVPKFQSAGGLVGDHTEGVEPTPGTFVATSTTVTPGAVSGKVEINREVLDAGGSPQADQIIWGEMLNAYYEMLEAKVADELAATPTAELNLGDVTDAALVKAIKNYVAGLQFVRGGNRFSAFAADGTLYPALIDAQDGQGRPLLPVVNAQNADGAASGTYDEVQIGSQRIRPAWALGSGNAALSYSFVPSSVFAWASAPKRFTFEYQVKSIDMAIWGYVATHTLRDSDVKPIDYTALDA